MKMSQYVDVLAILEDGSELPLIYLGEISVSQTGIEFYWITEETRNTFYNQSLGLQLLLIGYANYMYVSEKGIFYKMVDQNFKQKFESNIKEVEAFCLKWYEDDISPRSEIFPYYYYDNENRWEYIANDTLCNASFNVKLLTNDLDIFIGSEPIFIRKEYFQELKEEIDVLLQKLY